MDVVEGIYGENGNCNTDFTSIPLFRLTPDHIPGKAANIINGKIHRDGRAKLNQWTSYPVKSLPQWVQLDFDKEKEFSKIQIRFDVTERLWKEMYIMRGERAARRLVAEYKLETLTEKGWEVIISEAQNYRRFREYEFETHIKAKTLRLSVLKVWGEGEPARVYEIRLY